MLLFFDHVLHDLNECLTKVGFLQKTRQTLGPELVLDPLQMIAAAQHDGELRVVTSKR